MAKMYGIVFKDNGKVYNFHSDDLIINVNDSVIVETERGMQLGKCVEISENDNKFDTKPVLRVATKEDIDRYEKNKVDAVKALNKAKEFAQELDLEMNLLDATFTFDKKQLLIIYVADNRVDFRELAKKLAGVYHTRIELRQIGPRDKAKEIGGIGVCGRPLCCSNSLNKIDSVSMNMPKTQGIALNPTKINGLCGRLLCCFTYEQDVYEELQKDLPQIGQIVDTKFGKGKVINVDTLKQTYSVDIDGSIKVIEAKNESNK